MIFISEKCFIITWVILETDCPILRVVFILIYEYVSVPKHALCVHITEEGHKSSRARVTEACEPLDMGARN